MYFDGLSLRALTIESTNEFLCAFNDNIYETKSQLVLWGAFESSLSTLRYSIILWYLDVFHLLLWYKFFNQVMSQT